MLLHLRSYYDQIKHPMLHFFKENNNIKFKWSKYSQILSWYVYLEKKLNVNQNHIKIIKQIRIEFFRVCIINENLYYLLSLCNYYIKKTKQTF